MASNMLKKLLNKKDVKAILEHYRSEIAQDVMIHDDQGKTLWGDECAGQEYRQPIEASGAVLGWVLSATPVLTLAPLLSALARRNLEQKALAQETLEKYKEINLLYNISERVGKSFDLKKVAKSYVEEAKRSLSATNASIMLHEEKSKQLEIIAALGEKSQAPTTLTPGSGIAGHIFTSGKGEVINDVTADSRYLCGDNKAKSLICVPLKNSDTAFGVMNISNDSPTQFTAADLKLSTMLGSLAASAVENIKTQEKLLKEQLYSKAMAQDLEIGRKIQTSFFPDRVPELAGWEVAFRFKPARQVSGDFYDAFTVANDSFLVIVIADVCNKGVGAALFMGLFRSLLRAFADLHFPAAEAGSVKDCAEQRLHQVMMLTNNYIATVHGDANMFATIFLGLVDPKSGEIFYINGGHDAPVILHDAGIRCGLAPNGPAVGMFADISFEVGCAQLQPQEALVLFTDGVTEAMNEVGDLYSEERLMGLLEGNCPPPPAELILAQINEDLGKHVGSAGQSDDITLLSIRRVDTLTEASGQECLREETTMPMALEMSAPALRDNLSLFLDFIQDNCQAARLDDSICHDLMMSIEEVVLNLIDYAYQGEELGLIRVRLIREETRVLLEVEDQAPPFDPIDAPQPDLDSSLEERKIGGLGWFLVQQLMDEVTYQAATDDWNRLTLSKQL
jgi:serine phosphatase RsbU (regulator of sigma subunit)/anti-sigma regulatory factor (Ser/Thr protein kinase)